MLDGNELSVLIVAIGGIVILASSIRLLYAEQKHSTNRKDSAIPLGLPGLQFGPQEYITFAFVIVFLVTGISMIELRGMTHVESYIPGLELPVGISEPPLRIDFLKTVQWHWHEEPHPPGYFVLMWGWTKLFGTSLTAIRLPSLLLGCLAIATIFVLTSRIFASKWAGVIAAGMLALNGHHLHWALMARHYEAAMAVGLISLWLWLVVSSDRRPNLLVEVSYVFAITVGLYLHVLFWAFLLAQIIYVLGTRKSGQLFASRTFYLQVLAILFASPMFFHALYSGQGVASGGYPSISFAQDFITFGFLFQYDPNTNKDVPFLFELMLTLLALLCVTVFLRNKERFSCELYDDRRLPSKWPLVLISGGFSLIVWALVREAWHPSRTIFFAIAVPIIAIIFFALLSNFRVPRIWPVRKMLLALSPMPAVALVTLAIIYLISLQQPAAVSRGVLIAVPPLIVSIAGGLFYLLREKKNLGLTLIAVVFISSLYSIVWYKDYAVHSDYRGLAENLVDSLGPNDLIFVPHRDWATTPIFYHLSGHHHRLVATDYDERARDADRIWLISLENWPFPEIDESVSDFSKTESIQAHQIEASLYRRTTTKD